ncbi:hypothetical protein AVEN_80699-1 [Araneus ventricosus]|uniref:DUF4817 domain-containing protein n=1 Tax=Araneus ventricosus TaxID=182803 RepID=A0A4Y2Q0Q9_ARAVE|nr:hypothetical protein AVEN_80699-1 [Araneus ventricosus]
MLLSGLNIKYAYNPKKIVVSPKWADVQLKIVFFLVKTFYLCDQRLAETLRKWSSAFKNRPKPSSSMLTALIAKFERTGSVADDKVIIKTKQKTARRSEKITAAKIIVEGEPSTSTQHLAQQLDVSRATALRTHAETSSHYLLRWQTF